VLQNLYVFSASNDIDYSVTNDRDAECNAGGRTAWWFCNHADTAYFYSPSIAITFSSSYVYQQYPVCLRPGSTIPHRYSFKLTPWIRVLEKLTVPGLLHNSPRCVEPHSSWLLSLEPVTWSYPESDESNPRHRSRFLKIHFNPLNPELNPICYLLTLLGAHHFLHVSRIRVKLLTFRLLMSYIYGAPILDVSRSHTTTQHSR